MTDPRPPLSCKTCGDPFTITHLSVQQGTAYVRPGTWFFPSPAVHVWSARCRCPQDITANGEWRLYKALGFNVAVS